MTRLLLSTAIVGITILTSAASASERPVVVNVNFTQPYVPPNVPPTAPTIAESGAVAPVQPTPTPNPVNRHNLACYTNRNSPGCTNLRNEMIFIFGTCRQFFGEPCLPHPNSSGQGFFGMKGSSIFGGSTSGGCR